MGRLPSNELTPRQEGALRSIRNFIAHNSMPPTIRDLAKFMGISSSTAFYLLGELRKKGFVSEGSLRARTLVPSVLSAYARIEGSLMRLPLLTDRPAEKTAELAAIPIVGAVAAGKPILAVENKEGDLWVEKRIASRGRCFALKIKGDSMTGAGIQDGDIAVARQQPVAENGDIVVALLGDDATVKQLYIRGDHIELKPRNPKHRAIPISAEDELRILGKVIAVAAASQPHNTRRR